MTRILLVAPESPSRDATLRSLRELGHAVETVERGPADLGRYDLVLADARAVTARGGNVLEMADSAPLIVLSHDSSVRQAVRAVRRGARDYLTLPLDQAELREAISEALASAPTETKPFPMIGSSDPMRILAERIAKVAESDCPVLIEGEIGTGKELVARAIHAASQRRHGSFIILNCATVPPALIEGELFSHASSSEGVFSERHGDERRGLLQAAAGGTLFLDEVGELPPPVQARLLRVLTDQELDADRTDKAVAVRLITATHRNLGALVDSQQFRQDLFYRLNVVALHMPPLRERGRDVVELAQALLLRTCRRLCKPEKTFTQEAISAMLSYRWPGNVRELENAIERAVILSNHAEIDTELLAIDTSSSRAAEPQAHPADQTSLEDYFLSFVTANQDQMTETELAEKLGISRKSLWERRQRLNIPRKRTRKRGPRREESS
jgi:two-component system response regulator HydG